MHQFIRLWKGRVTTNWDANNGVGPRQFRLNPTSVHPNSTSLAGTFDGDGSAYDGKAFDIRHGKYRIQSNNTTHITFDMKFISEEPTATFSGYMDAQNAKLTGTIKLKHPDYYDAPHTGGAYADFHATVSLH